MTALGHPTMLGFGWLTLRQAQEAVESGRLEEAQRLLGRPEALGHKGSSALLKQIAQAYIERGEQHMQHEDLAAAWKDLKEAEKIGTSGAAAAAIVSTALMRAWACGERSTKAWHSPGRWRSSM